MKTILKRIILCLCVAILTIGLIYWFVDEAGISNISNGFMNILLYSMLISIIIQVCFAKEYLKGKHYYYTNYFDHLQLRLFVGSHTYIVGLIGSLIVLITCFITPTIFTDIQNSVIASIDGDAHFSTSAGSVFNTVIIAYNAIYYIWLLVFQFYSIKAIGSEKPWFNVPYYNTKYCITKEFLTARRHVYTKDYLSNRSAEDINLLAQSTLQNLFNSISAVPETIVENLTSANLEPLEMSKTQDINVLFCLCKNWHRIDDSKLCSFIYKNSDAIIELYSEMLYVARMYENCTHKNLSFKRKSHITNKCAALISKQHHFMQSLNCDRILNL